MTTTRLFFPQIGVLFSNFRKRAGETSTCSYAPVPRKTFWNIILVISKDKNFFQKRLLWEAQQQFVIYGKPLKHLR